MKPASVLRAALFNAEARRARKKKGLFSAAAELFCSRNAGFRPQAGLHEKKKRTERAYSVRLCIKGNYSAAF